MLQMGLHVTVDAIFAFECARANRTVKAVVLRVGDHVAFQQGLFHELGRTLRAIDWPATKQEECVCVSTTMSMEMGGGEAIDVVWAVKFKLCATVNYNYIFGVKMKVAN